tara:strand:- start:72 stop:344 length:273 start_codon:yes stop_codon:yes gene_type:complete
MKITKSQLKQIIKEELEKSRQTFNGYSDLAVELAREATQTINYPQGGVIEAEIQSLMDKMPNISDGERREIADEALSVAGIMLGVGPDAL